MVVESKNARQVGNPEVFDVDDIIARGSHAKPRKYHSTKKTGKKVSDFVGIIEDGEILDSTKEHDLI